jgi:hypothetical protein
MSFSGSGSCNVRRRERYRQQRAAQLVEPGREALTVLVGLRSAGVVVIPACYLPWPGSAIMMSILAKLRNTVTEVLPSPSCAVDGPVSPYASRRCPPERAAQRVATASSELPSPRCDALAPAVVALGGRSWSLPHGGSTEFSDSFRPIRTADPLVAAGRPISFGDWSAGGMVSRCCTRRSGLRVAWSGGGGASVTERTGGAVVDPDGVDETVWRADRPGVR